MGKNCRSLISKPNRVEENMLSSDTVGFAWGITYIPTVQCAEQYYGFLRTFMYL